jgi:two-component system response regulator CssR
MYNVYVVEDEKDLNNLVKSYLEKEEYNVVQFFDGETAIKHVGDKVHLWVLDIMLSGDVSGYDIIKKIRETDEVVPVIFTSARDKDLDKIVGLELGSDDYLAKPFSPKELVLRINRIIKRVYNEECSVYKLDEYVINSNKRTVMLGEKNIELTTLEFELLLLLIRERKNSLSREQILDSIWGNNYYGSDRAVDDLVRRLRKKMDKLTVDTIYGYGYRLL